MTSGSDLDSGDSQVTLPAGQGAGGPAPDTDGYDLAFSKSQIIWGGQGWRRTVRVEERSKF